MYTSTAQTEPTAPIEPSGPSPQPIITGPFGLTSAPKLGPVRSILSVFWALLPTFSFGLLTPLLAPLSFAYAAARLRKRRLWFFSATYGLTSLISWILCIIAIEEYWVHAFRVFYAILFAVGVIATIHAFQLRRSVFAPPSTGAASAP